MSTKTLVHSQRSSHFTSGENMMSDRNTWKVIGTMVLLFCAWLVIRQMDASSQRQAAEKRYKTLEAVHMRQEADDELYIKYGKMTREQAFESKRQRELEDDRFRAENAHLR